jgi:AcrR family transcriptional regulator
MVGAPPGKPMITEHASIVRMPDPPSYREANRNRLRDSLITAARDLTIAHGWDSVRMVDVAQAVGVSRQTVYNEFESKTGLADALTLREIQAFVADVRAQLFEHGDDIRAAARAAIGHTFAEAAGNPLVRAILTSTPPGADDLLPYLTTRAEAVLVTAGEVIVDWARACLPGLDEARVAVAAESIIRLTVSHIVLPSAPPDVTATALADVLVRLLS